jgi:bla regulator protein blaR1
MRAIVAHEMAHVRRRDNLTFALHMVVETLFWFHPLVWWIGLRLIDERERACDEAVVHAGGKAETYAEGILNVCKFCLEAPLPCVSGVTGADLKKRILRIMAEQIGRKLNLRRKALLAAAGAVAVIVPIVAGLVAVGHSAAQSPAANAVTKVLGPMPADADPSFEVATVKPSNPNDQSDGFHTKGRQISIENESVDRMLMFAYGVHAKQIVDSPAWLDHDRFDIDGIPDIAGRPSLKQMQALVRKVLANRFQLKFHHETRELAVYAITEAKGGLKLTKGSEDPNDEGWSTLGNGGQFTMKCKSMSMLDFTSALQRFVDRPVVDQTKLPGRWNFEWTWTPDDARVAPSVINPAPGMFTAIQEQLGLKLDAVRAPADVIVIDRIEPPSAN